jgi:regulation of enolase protein 1 (concanavalin A-like superfamily)
LKVATGTLTLASGTTFKVNNTGSALTAGSYKIISKGTGAVAGTVPAVTVTGGGIAGGTVATLQITSGELYLTITPSPPAAPANVVATPGNALVSLSWNASSGATSYNVKRSLTNGGPYTVITNVTSLTYTNTGLTNGTAYYYVISALNAAGEGANSVQVSATPSGLPSPWLTMDIGAVGLAGSASENSGTYTVKGSGAGITGTADQFRYVYQTMSGDGSIKVRIVSHSSSLNTSLSGVMIRETTNANSRFAMTAHRGSGNSNMRALRRTSTGGSMSSVSSTSMTPPNCWVQVTRTGSSFVMQSSTNGTTWTTIDTRTITMATDITVGLVSTSSSNTVLNTNVFDNVIVVP